MQVEVLIFGLAAQTAKADRVAVTVGKAPTVAEIITALTAQHPNLKFALASPRLAVNHAFVPPQTPICPGDEVALITLVGGG